MEIRDIHDLLRLHEGLRLKPYKDTVGHLTIGYGRNLDAKGITLEEANRMLMSDIGDAYADAIKFICVSDEGVKVWEQMGQVRKAVLVDMAFNMGFGRLRRFKKLHAALLAMDYEKASQEMLDSRWAQQVKGRAARLARMMKNDEWPKNGR